MFIPNVLIRNEQEICSSKNVQHINSVRIQFLRMKYVPI